MYSAIQEHKLPLPFHIREGRQSDPRYSKVCKVEERPVTDEEAVKAFEWEKGKYVPMRDEDFQSAVAAEGHRRSRSGTSSIARTSTRSTSSAPTISFPGAGSISMEGAALSRGRWAKALRANSAAKAGVTGLRE